RPPAAGPPPGRPRRPAPAGARDPGAGPHPSPRPGQGRRRGAPPPAGRRPRTPRSGPEGEMRRARILPPPPRGQEPHGVSRDTVGMSDASPSGPEPAPSSAAPPKRSAGLFAVPTRAELRRAALLSLIA